VCQRHLFEIIRGFRFQDTILYLKYPNYHYKLQQKYPDTNDPSNEEHPDLWKENEAFPW